MTEQKKITWQERHAQAAARIAAEEALPDEVKRLLDAVRWRMVSGNDPECYRILKAEAVKIWGAK
jgi:hypothetical protein